MKTNYKYSKIVIAITAILICLSFVCCNEKQIDTKDKPSIDTLHEFIRIYVERDTSNYITSVIPEFSTIFSLKNLTCNISDD